MSKYTTEIRFICETEYGLVDSKAYKDVDTIIAGVRDKIFDFNYPIFDVNYKSVLEHKILKHFYTREIGFETVGRWKLGLNTKLNEIMVYYNKLYNSELLEYNPLYTSDITRTHDKRVDNDTTSENKQVDGTKEKRTIGRTGSTTGNNTNTTTGSATGSNSNTNYELYSDTPQGALTGVESERYLTDARKTTDSGTSNTTTNNSSTGNSSVSTSDNETINGDIDYTSGRTGKSNQDVTEHYLETVVGYSGSNPNKSIADYRANFLNIDMMIINDLEELFMQIW